MTAVMTAVMIDTAPLLEAVRADAPGGSDPREGEAFEALQAELDRLTNPSASGVPDWRKVEQRGSELLRTEGKDFLVAAWLSAAWIDRAGIDGFGAGLQLMAGLADAIPPTDEQGRSIGSTPEPSAHRGRPGAVGPAAAHQRPVCLPVRRPGAALPAAGHGVPGAVDARTPPADVGRDPILGWEVNRDG